MKLSKDINQVSFFFPSGILLLNIYQLTTGYTGFPGVCEEAALSMKTISAQYQGAWAPRGEAQMQGNEPTGGCR